MKGVVKQTMTVRLSRREDVLVMKDAVRNTVAAVSVSAQRSVNSTNNLCHVRKLTNHVCSRAVNHSACSDLLTCSWIGCNMKRQQRLQFTEITVIFHSAC